MPGTLKIYWSIDRAANEEDNKLYLPDYFHIYNKPSLPPHRLKVKVGVLIIILRNLDTSKLYNITRIMPTKYSDNIFKDKIVINIYNNEKILLFKI